jgi:hypothetical protein
MAVSLLFRGPGLRLALPAEKLDFYFGNLFFCPQAASPQATSPQAASPQATSPQALSGDLS